MRTCILIFFSSLCIPISAQNVGINKDGSAPDPSAILDIKSTTSGLLIPRLTTIQRIEIVAPAVGLVVYDLETQSFWFYTGSDWMEVLSGFVRTISDADHDTRIEVEQSTDEDTIRFTTDGIEYMRLAKGRIEVVNTGGSVFIGEDAGENDNLLSRQNVYIGFQSGRSNISGAANIGIGYQSLFSSPDGFWNSAIGYGALKSNLTAHGNTAIGFQTLNLNTLGILNTAIGYRAMESNVSGSTNIAVGSKALFNNVDRSNLVAVGDSALFSNGLDAIENYHATNNTAIGSKALFKNTTGNDNTATGYLSMYTNDSGYRNSAFGKESLYSNSSGRYNNVLGNRALYHNKEGSFNVAVGSSSLYNNTSGNNNTAIGNRPLNNNTIGEANVAIGSEALFHNTEGSYLVAVGDSALFNNGFEATDPTHGEGNVAMGSKSLYSNTIGSRNTAVGSFALQNNISGFWNTAFGYEALKSNNTSGGNTAMGYQALYNNEGGLNTAVGKTALYRNTIGDYNSAFGDRALFFNSEGTANVAVGESALRWNNTGSTNTAVGSYAGYSTISSGNVFLGYRAGYSELDSNRLYIHNDSTSNPLIYGEFDNALVKINGRIMVGDNDISIPAAGSIRWNETFQDFEGYTGSEWKSLTYQGKRWGTTIMEDDSDTSPDKQASDQFGRSVDMDGDWAIVGAPYHDNVFGNDGKAYLFRREGSNWIWQEAISASDRISDDYFGISVSISGDYAIVGAIGHDTIGQAYIYYRTGYDWNEQAVLSASDGAKWDRFGGSVSISGDYAIIGANGHDTNGNADQGKAYVFHRSGTSWVEEDILFASDGEAGDYFGDGVAISGDYVIVGASRHYTSGNEVEGKAYVFHRSGSNWLEENMLTASDGNQGDQFGSSISIYGDLAIIGAPNDWHPLGTPGKAYIFHRSGSNWTEQAKLSASDGIGSLDHFGRSVSIYGDFAIVGARRSRDPGGNDEQGRAYIFHRSGSNWTEEAKLQASDGSNPDEFGYSVSLSGNCAIVGRLNDKLYFFRK